MYENLYYTKIRINFAVSSDAHMFNFNSLIMKLTKKEEELIAAIRNYRTAYPDSKLQLLYYAQQVFEELLDEDAE